MLITKEIKNFSMTYFIAPYNMLTLIFTVLLRSVKIDNIEVEEEEWGEIKLLPRDVRKVWKGNILK